MTTALAILPAQARTEGFERIDILDWDEIHEAVQSVLQEMDQSILKCQPGVGIKCGKNQAPKWFLFSHRVYQPAGNSEIDPVVVGVDFAPGSHGVIVHGDAAGETLGDVLLDLSPREVIGKLAILEAARDLAEQLTHHAACVAEALKDSRRQV